MAYRLSLKGAVPRVPGQYYGARPFSDSAAGPYARGKKHSIENGPGGRMKISKMIAVLALIVAVVAVRAYPAEEDAAACLMSSASDKEDFARRITVLLGKAWKKWQDSVVVNNVEIESSRGMLAPGNIAGPVLTSSSILSGMDKKDRSQEYLICMRAVAGAIENGMRSWQRGYFHDNIPFPQGASCVYTLPPCSNVPVSLASGASTGEGKITEEALYSYMLYRSPGENEDVIVVLKAAAKAFSDRFEEWKQSCSIVGIRASGGIAPAPAPMGTGPGSVSGAKGAGGKLIGAYLDTDRMYGEMVGDINKREERRD